MNCNIFFMKLFFFFLFFSLTGLSQNITKHNWKNRVLLVFSNDTNQDDFKKQQLILEEKVKELKERKVVVYLFTKSDYNFNFDENWVKSTKLSLEFTEAKNTFKVILIGLDGGIKLAQDSILSSEKLFTIIDGMPMRKRELRKNKE